MHYPSEPQTTRSDLDMIGGDALGDAMKEMGRGAPFSAVELQYLAGVVLWATMPSYRALPSMEMQNAQQP